MRVLDEYLAARLATLEAASPRLHAALQRRRAGTVPVLIGTPAQLQHAPGGAAARLPRLSMGRAAEFLALHADGTDSLVALLVRVDLGWLARYHRAWINRNAPWSRSPSWLQRRFDRLVETVLVHEVWGHLVPVAEAGSLAGQCPDPRAGQPPEDSCVMRRENELRAELGWRPRRAYALDLDSDPFPDPLHPPRPAARAAGPGAERGVPQVAGRPRPVVHLHPERPGSFTGQPKRRQSS